MSLQNNLLDLDNQGMMTNNDTVPPAIDVPQGFFNGSNDNFLNELLNNEVDFNMDFSQMDLNQTGRVTFMIRKVHKELAEMR